MAVALATLAIGGLIQVAIAGFFIGRMRQAQEGAAKQVEAITRSLDRLNDFRSDSETGLAAMLERLGAAERTTVAFDKMRDEFIELRTGNALQHQNYETQLERLTRVQEGHTRALSNLSQGKGFAPSAFEGKGAGE